ncbi:hypothetical protein FN846DRAFT_432610 [Sphaerosporella brunnea]|uniref:Uncharacterized protein n=1 Tax=Sphaerosporella brunnea TaxID=1250544 RepID=A0A5J5EF34_9PEZI|nr:hypothetical protein FN846DRAFT_432610 [Sphaerosporella brunnea]
MPLRSLIAYWMHSVYIALAARNLHDRENHPSSIGRIIGSIYDNESRLKLKIGTAATRSNSLDCSSEPSSWIWISTGGEVTCSTHPNSGTGNSIPFPGSHSYLCSAQVESRRSMYAGFTAIKRQPRARHLLSRWHLPSALCTRIRSSGGSPTSIIYSDRDRQHLLCNIHSVQMLLTWESGKKYSTIHVAHHRRRSRSRRWALLFR